MQRIDALQLAINAMILRHVQLSQCCVCGAEALECEEALKVLDQMKKEMKDEAGQVLHA